MIAALYDIHGNLPALEAVLADVRASGAQRIVVGGDVFPGPLAGEALECLRALDVPVEFIRGNGERNTLDIRAGRRVEVPELYIESVRWGAERVTEEQAAFMASWPATLEITVEARRVLFCHATPQNDADIFTRLTPEPALVAMFAGVDVDLVVCGHTHMQFDRRVGGVRVVNAGSVGMPFGAPGAYWLLMGDDVEFRRTGYDLSKAAQSIRASRYPLAEQFAASSVLNPPAEEQMLELFEKR